MRLIIRPGIGAGLASIVLLAACLGACAPPAPSAAPSASAPAGSPSPAPSPSVAGSPSPTAPAASRTPAPSYSPAAPTFVVRKVEPCPESRFTCVTLGVPRDHHAADGPTWDVTFAIQRATGQRKGVFVTITGGPGTSGIASADSYTDAFAEEISRAYDIVFLDQRGIGLSRPLQCPGAAAAWYRSDARVTEPGERAQAEAAAAEFVDDCLAETKVDRADLPYFATSQAVEDLEAFRAYLGVDRLYLYGESYGTQYVQTYAAAHPDHVAALLVDGPVDLTMDAIAYYVESARGGADALVQTLADCRPDRTCRTDTRGGDLLKAYDDLAARLQRGPITFRFPTAKGTFAERTLSFADLENAAGYNIYGPADRQILQRALTASTQGDYGPLARLAYDAVGLDPETLQAVEDPTWSDAMYYAVECMDYAFLPDTGDSSARLDAWLAAGVEARVDDLRLGSAFYGDLPCLYWPVGPSDPGRPAPIVDPPYPTFVLTATVDPATPIGNAMRIFGRLSDAYFLEAIGGAHVIFGRGDACPDDIVTRFLADGTLPQVRVISCPNVVVDDYVANARPKLTDYRTALDFMVAMDDQVTTTYDYAYRLEDEPLTIGCNLGGTLTYVPDDTGTGLKLDRCAFSQAGAMTGSGRIDDDAGTVRLTVRLPGGSSLRYFEDDDGNHTVRGTFGGRPVNLRD